MRYRLAFAALLLPLAGCVVPPGPGPYGGYPQPGYPGPYAQQDLGYPGYAYNDGSPTLVVEGVTWPLIFYGGGWGYWDGEHRWHGAPGRVGNWLSERHPGGVGYRPYGGGEFGHPVGLRPGGFGGYPPPGGGRVGPGPGPGPGGFRSPPPGSVRPAAAPSRQAPPPQRHREDEHH
jgi:hypothetical protein